MSKIKFVQNKVYNYVKGKSVVELAFELLAFGVLNANGGFRNTIHDSRITNR